MKKLLSLTLLLMIGMIVSAEETQESEDPSVTQEVVVSVSKFTGGTVDVKPKEGQVVTITVTPADGYYIAKGDIEVIAVMDPSLATRGDEGELPAGVVLTLEGEDPADLTLSRDYTFTVPEGLGAWVRKAVFHEVDKPVTSGNLTESVTWEVTTNTEVKTPQVTLTLAGDGSATIDGETAVPWKDFEDQITNLVIGEGVQELGDGLLGGCTALKTITLEGKKFVPLGKNELTKDVTVDVYGVLYNEYKDDAAWGTATIASTGSEKMEGVAFGKGNTYDLFVTKQPMLIPSVLKGYSVTAIDGSNVKISSIDDRIIPAGVPVLLFSETVKDDDFRTVTTEEKGTAEAGLLKAAGSGGQPVKLGGAYLLYNNVFYLSQEGTIPEGGVYIPVSDGKEEQGQDEKKDNNLRVRSFLTIGGDEGDGTSAIDASHLSPLTSHLSKGWYDLSGRRLNSAPTAKGIYIHAGKKVVIK
jgi:hypothetical protein